MRVQPWKFPGLNSTTSPVYINSLQGKYQVLSRRTCTIEKSTKAQLFIVFQNRRIHSSTFGQRRQDTLSVIGGSQFIQMLHDLANLHALILFPFESFVAKWIIIIADNSKENLKERTHYLIGSSVELTKLSSTERRLLNWSKRAPERTTSLLKIEIFAQSFSNRDSPIMAYRFFGSIAIFVSGLHSL